MVNAALKVNPIHPAEAAQPRLSKLTVFAVIAILGCSYSFNGMDRQVFPALLGPINKEYGLTLAQGGLLSNAFAAMVVVFGALSGWFMNRFGRKATLVGGLIAYSFFTFLTPFATNFTELAFYRSMTGAGEALHISAIFAMIGAYFGPRRGTFAGINNAFFGIGAFLGPFLGTRLFVSYDSWHTAFYVYGIAGTVAALAVLFFVPTAFSAAIDSEASVDGREDVCPDQWFNRNSMLCAVAFALVGYSFFAYGALYTTYLRTQLGFSITDAGATFGMYGIGTLVAFVGGWLGDKLKRTGFLGSLAILAIVSYFLFHDVRSMLMQSLLSFIFGAMVSGYLYPRFVAVVQRSVQSHHIGNAMALLIPTFYIAGLFAGWSFGKLVPVFGWSEAATISVALPAALACVVTYFQDPSRMRGA